MRPIFKGFVLSSIRKAKGQSSILGIAFGLMLITGIYTVYNVGQVTNEKTRLVNATDAAAYSAGIHVARNLNYVAYTNRAMMANHIAIGHLTSYYSWVHYGQEMTGVVSDICDVICNFILYVGWLIDTYVDYAEEAFDLAVDIVEEYDGAEYIAILNDITNGLYYVSQQGAAVALAPTSLYDVQDEILQSYDDNISRHQGGVPISGNLKLSYAVTRSAVDLASIATFLRVSSYTPENDDDFIKNMVDKSVGVMASERSDRWMRLKSSGSQSRDWSIGLWPIFEAEKQGETDHYYEENDSGDPGLVWETSDEFAFSFNWDWSKWEWGSSLGTGKHTAQTHDDIYDGYQGIANYKAEDEQLDDCFQPAFTSVGLVSGYDCHSITVVAAKNLSNARMMQKGPNANPQSNNDLYAIARSEVYFYRPENMWGALGTDSAEFANVFNPFWKARLSD